MKAILGENILEEARQYRGSGDERAWEMADWIAGVVAECARQPGEQTMVIKIDGQKHTVKRPSRSDILRTLAGEMGVSRATTSDLCQLAETYEVGVRDDYPTLTVGHFREAMRCRTVPAVKLLELAVKSEPEWQGQPIPIDALRQKVRKYNADVKPAETPAELYKLALDKAAKAIGAALDLAPREDQQSLHSMIAWLSKVNA